MIDLTDEVKVLNLLNRAVAEKGADYVYPNSNSNVACTYFDLATGAPSCLVGHVLFYEGATADEFVDNNVSEVQLLDEEQIEATDKTLFLLSAAQNNQDGGMTWGESVEKAVFETRLEFDS